MIRRPLLVTLGALALASAPARAAGSPALPGYLNGHQGIRSPNGRLFYTAAQAGRATKVHRTGAGGSLGYRLAGQWRLPLVANDGTPLGVSRDGRTLILIGPRRAFPQRTSRLAVLDAGTLRVRTEIRLRGDFVPDAISPQGRWLYLIQYTSGTDATRYRVRALDLRSHRLLARPIVDPRDREQMGGSPVTRVASADGRWAYTLYSGSKQPFVHALDTAGLTARCIDVGGLPANTNPWVLHLHLDAANQRLVVVSGRRSLAWVDLRTFSAHALPAPARPAPRPNQPGSGRGGDGSTWAAVGLIAVFVAAGAGLLVLRRRVGAVADRIEAR